MFRTVNDFLQTWQAETENTKRLLGTLTDESLGYTAQHFPRSVGRVSQHLAESIPFFMNMIGVTSESLDSGRTPTSSNALRDEYERFANAAKAQAEKLTDAQLLEPIPFFGSEAPRGQALSVMVAHQTHHRGELVVLAREAGLPSVSVYGPTREDWVKMGREPQP